MFSLLSRTAIGAVVALAALPEATGQDKDRDNGGSVVIDVDRPQRSRYPIAIPLAATGDGATGKTIQEVMAFDMSVAGWFKVLDSKTFTANLSREGTSIDPSNWKEVGAFSVVKYRSVVSGNRLTITFKLYEIEKGGSPVLEKTYRGSRKDVRQLTHMWCNAMVKHFTGEDGFFGSKISFTVKGRGYTKRVMAMDFDGHSPYSVTRNRYANILPAFSPDGGRIAFTSYMRDNPDLYVVGAGGGRPKRISKRFGMNTGASWSPDGSQIALTLSKDGNPEIYIISASSGTIVRRITKNRHIDTSPAWSPDGKEIAFVSDRQGSPQIFVVSASGGSPRRVSKNGNYNTTPAWSPVKGQRRLAYTTRAGSAFDIVTLDLGSGRMTRITQNEGNNEEPSFSPNGRAIAFASSRSAGSGIYIANADGTGDAVRVYRGGATSVDWGPAPAE
jgi:TolB protein